MPRVSLKLYLLTEPDEQEARDAKARIYALEAKEKLANEPGVRKRKLLQSLDSAVFMIKGPTYNDGCAFWGAYLVRGTDVIVPVAVKQYPGAIQPSALAFTGEWRRFPLDKLMTYEGGEYQITLSLSPDANIRCRTRMFRAKCPVAWGRRRTKRRNSVRIECPVATRLNRLDFPTRVGSCPS